MGSERPSIFAELRRRNVYRVAIVYAGAAFAVLQVADLAFPRLGLPDWTVTLVLGLSALGFPVAVLCAWIFDLTPDGLKRTRAAAPRVAVPTSPLRVMEFVLIVGLIGAVGYLYATRLTPSRSETAAGRATETAMGIVSSDPMYQRSIAVLPFVNMSTDPDNEYFSDGVSEELLDGLARLGTLRVAARTSSFAFKNQNEDVRAIGLRLGVETILEGSVRKAGSRVRITAQLINARNGYHLWSQTYDRELDDIFAVQDEIARAIVSALHVPLGLEAGKPLVETGTSNVDAYNAYLRGRHHFKRIGPGNYQKTLEYMERAIELDPEYAAPYGGLAYAHQLSALWLPKEKVFPRAKAAFDRALELDPALGVALVTKAQYLTLNDWNWLEAKSYFTRALEDESETTLATIAYATLHLVPMGQIDEARALLAEAATRDPVDPRVKMVRASLAMFMGELDWAIAQYQLTLELDEESIQSAAALCSAYAATGDLTGAEGMIEGWLARLGFAHPWLLACRATVELARGRPDDALRTYQAIAQAAAMQPGVAFFAGDVALRLGKIDEAIAWYERSIDEGEIAILMTRIRHAREPALTSHPRYQALLARMKLDDLSLAKMGYQPAQSI